MAAIKLHVKKNDTVMILAGKDKGKSGKVLRVLAEKQRVLVESLNTIKRHTRPTQANSEGGIIEKEMPLHISNIMLFNPMTNKGDRVGFKVLEDGRKVRYFKSNGEVVDV